MQVLQRQWDRTFSDHSYGFRPGRSAHQAVAQAQQYIAEGYGWCVDFDLEKFFDRVNHDKLMGQIAKRVEDKRLLKLIRAFLNAGVMENGLVSPSVEGTPQGGPLSPLLSNLVLDELDRELERRGLRFVRYADDCNIYVRSERAGQRVMESVTRFITQKLKLKVNEAKSAVARPQERKFLGFSFTAGPEVKRTIAPKALDRFKGRIREITRRAKGVSIETTIEELAPYMRGWRSYFGFCETPEVLVHLTRWVRLRLRAALVAAVENTAPSPGRSVGTGGSPATGQQHGRQRSRSLVPREGQSPVCGAFQCILQIARTSDIDRWVLAQPTRTAVYGPVRTVVWQGSAGDRRPYADQVGMCREVSRIGLRLATFSERHSQNIHRNASTAGDDSGMILLRPKP